MSLVTNNKLLGGTNGCVRLNVLGKVLEKKSSGSALSTLTVGDIALFSVKLGVIEKGLSVDMTTIQSKERETADNFKCDGTKSAKTRGNVVTTDKTLDFNLDDDYNWVINNIDPATNKSVIASMIDGKTFLASAGAATDGTKDKVMVVGFQGTSTIGTVVTDQDFKYVGEREGLMIDPNLVETDGSAKLFSNTEIGAYFDTPMISVEGMWEYAGQTKKGFGSIFNFCTTHTFNESGDAGANSNSFSLRRLADVRSKSLYMVEDESDAQDVSGSPASTTNIERVGRASNGVTTGNIFYGEVDTTDSVISTVTLTNGVAGDIIVLVGDGTNAGDNNEVFVFVVSDATTATAINANYNLIQGARIHTTQTLSGLVTATGAVVIDASAGTDSFGKVNIKTAGASGSAIPVSFGALFNLEIYDWSFADQKMITYIGTEV